MTFEIIEWFQTVITLVARFAECGPKTADLHRVFCTASGAGFWLVQMIFIGAFFRWCDAVNS